MKLHWIFWHPLIQKWNSFEKTIIEICSDINPFKPSVALHIETSHQSICNGNQMTDFYMKCNTELKWLNINISERDIDACHWPPLNFLHLIVPPFFWGSGKYKNFSLLSESHPNWWCKLYETLLNEGVTFHAILSQ